MQLPYLPYEEWNKTRITLHLVFQIIGKIRLKSTPRKNHWWYITLYLSSKGFTTHPIPYDDGINTFEITINVHKQVVEIQNSKGDQIKIPLKNGYPIKSFYYDLMGVLKGWGLEPHLIKKPFDMGVEEPFDQISDYHHYDWKAIFNFWQMMLFSDGVFKEFSGRFYGKTCPVHLYWHHMDLAVTRFSGKAGPPVDPKASLAEKDAYSHEVISFGFWAGDDNLPEPAFYSYTAPSPDQMDKEPLKPDQAFWMNANGSPMAILKYKDLLDKPEPRKALLDFLESAYLAGAKLANWDVEGLKVPPLEKM